MVRRKQKIVVQFSEAETKEIANSLLAEAQRARRRGGTAKQPFSHGDTAARREKPSQKTNSQLLAEKQPNHLNFSAPPRLSVLCERVV
jgi:hypothetical protein